MKSITKRIISTLAICGALVLEAGAVAFGSLGKNSASRVDAAEQTVSTAVFTKNSLGEKGGKATLYTGSYAWSLTRTIVSGSGYTATGVTNGYVQMGSNGNVETAVITTDKIEGTIKSVSVDCAAYNGAHNISISVGSTSYKSDKVPKWSSNNGGTITGTGTSSGAITISFTNATGARALYLKSISVTFEEKAANQLDTPKNIAYSNGTLTWDAVEHATGYKVSVKDGAATTVTDTSYAVALPQLASVSVIATDSTSTYKDSSAATYLYKNRGSSTNPLSVSDAVTLIEYETGKVNSHYTEEKIYVTGVTTADSAYNSTYSNYDKITISDGENTLTIQRATRSDDKTDTIKAGSTVVGYGYGEYYNGCTLYPKGSDNPVLTSVIGQTYTVSYKPGAYGTGSEQSDVKEEGVALTLKGAIFSRTGYTQTGWSTSDGGAKVYELNGSYTADAAATLYPYWEIITYTVSYDRGAYGTGTNTSDTKTYNNSLTLKGAIFTRAGYTQTGWSTTDGGEKAYELGGTYTDNAGTTLYPYWSQKASHSVTYNLNGGSGTAPVQADVIEELTFTVASATGITKDHYTFAGWSDGSTTYAAGSTYTMGTSNVTLTAQWTAIKHSVTYVANGATGTVPTQSDVAETETFTVAAGTGLSKEHCSFAGWSDGVTVYQAGQTYTMGTSNVTLTAQWEEIKHSVTYSAGEGSGTVPTQEDVVEGSTFTLAEATGLSKQDYHFVGWNDGSATYEAGTTYTMGTSNVTLTAQWELDKVSYSVAYSLIGVTVPGDAPTSVDEGDDLVVAITPNQHYKIETMGVTMGGETAEYTYENGVLTVENVTGNIVVTVSAAEKWYGATTQSSQNVTFGSIDSHLYHNEPFDVDVTANTGCHIVDEYSSVAMQGESGFEDIPGAYSNGHVHVDHVTGNLIIQIIAVKDTFSVSTTLNDSVVAEGSELPETVEYGDDLNVTFEPKTGYQINSITYKVGDAAEQTVTGSTLSIENITANVSITVNTSKIVYSVTATYGDSTNSNTTTSIEYGDSYSGKITPNEGKKFTSISMTMGGNPVTVADDGTYNIASVTGNIVINVVTEDITYEVSATGSHYTNSNTATSVLWHGAYEATITPDDGYFIEDLDVTMGGESVTVSIAEHGTSATISIASVTGDIDIDVTSTEIEMTGIVSAATKEADYEFGYDFDESDVAVVASFNDGTTGSVDATSVEGYDITKSGSQTVTVKVGEFEKDITVVVRQSTIVDSIVASTEKTEVEYGGTFTKEDVSVTYVYTDGHTLANQEAESISGFDPNEVGAQTVTVTAADKTDTITVTVLPSTVVQSIEASTEKTEIEYGGTLTPEDITVIATYTDGHTGEIDCESIFGFSGTTVGLQNVTVNAGGKQDVIQVTVKPSEVIDHIEASTEKSVVDYGGTFTKEDVSVTYVYTDGHTVEGQPAESISEFNPTQIGEQEITVTAAGKTTTITITVNGHVVLSLDVTGYDTTVDQGKDYVFNGTVTAHYADGTTEDVTATAEISKVDTSGHGLQTAKVSFGGVSTEITVNVIQTKTPIDAVQAVAIGGGCVVGVAILAVGLYYLLKMFKL